jgi:type II secretory pathway predicted ATPase ExeA
MYSQFFGFDKLPFRLRPDPDFLYSGREYLSARSSLIAALQSSSRVILFTGLPGVGKTLLLDDILREVSGQFACCRINQPNISAIELLQALLLQLAAPGADAASGRLPHLEDLSATLEPAGESRAPALLIIDDAQMLPSRTLLALTQMLAGTKRLKILLVARQGLGQNEIDLPLRQNFVEKQRVALEPLTIDGVKAYVDHRLRLVGGGSKEVFTTDALLVLSQLTSGSPRLINVLCDAALHSACLRASSHVSGTEIVLASQNPRWPEALARDRAVTVIDEAINALTVVAVAPIALATPPSVPQAVPRVESTTASAEGSPAAVSAHFIISYRKAHVQALPLKPGRLSIGRAADNLLRLDAPDISRHHCEVVVSAGVSVIEDLGSINGVNVNGRPVKKHILKHADVVTIGEHVLRYVVA